MWRTFTSSLLLFLSLTTTARANPWGHELGHGYLKVGTTYFTAEESFQQGMPTGLAYEAVTVNLYAEIGLPWRFTAIVDLPYVIARNRGDRDIHFLNHTLGDGRFELDYRLTRAWPISVGFESKVPLYDLARDRGTAGLVEVDGLLWSASNFPDVGDGNVDLTFKAMAGTSVSLWLPGWATAMVGYRKRIGVFADSFVGAFSVGAVVWKPYVSASIFGDGMVKLQKDADLLSAASREYFYLQGELSFGGLPVLPGLGLSIAVGRVLVVANSSKGTSVAVGLSYKR